VSDMRAQRIRKAGPEDWPQLLHVEEKCFSSDRVSAERFRYYLRRQSILVLLAEALDEGETVEAEGVETGASGPASGRATEAVGRSEAAGAVAAGEAVWAAAGYAMVFFRKDSVSCRLYSLAVMPEFRGGGTVRALMETIYAEMARRGLRRLVLEVRPDNAAAIRYYEKNGFTVFGRYENFYEDGSYALRMEKILTLERAEQGAGDGLLDRAGEDPVDSRTKSENK